MKSCVRVIISGRVQGVWFRASTKQKAKQLKLDGWVRNNPDGNVEAVFEGEESHIKEILNWCKRGPPLAKVTNVEIKYEEPTNGFENFFIK
ncbi:acylphosphatase [Thermoplasmatales archaeon SG8-52-4]|nr:MAG: acylphosphatase [Thermoplasmatales archaeon SG8-52-4]